jgi:hypothetical protein
MGRSPIDGTMARPRKSLLVRCLERSFRPRHHWRLLAADPVLPVRRLAELQRQTRTGDRDRRELARAFAPQLRHLSDRERDTLRRHQTKNDSPPVADWAGDEDDEPPLPWGETDPLARVEATLEVLRARIGGEFTDLEQLQASCFRHTARRLIDVRQTINREGTTVKGSRGQPRPHPLLTHEHTLTTDLLLRLPRFQRQVCTRAELDIAHTLQLATRHSLEQEQPQTRQPGPDGDDRPGEPGPSRPPQATAAEHAAAQIAKLTANQRRHLDRLEARSRPSSHPSNQPTTRALPER